MWAPKWLQSVKHSSNSWFLAKPVSAGNGKRFSFKGASEIQFSIDFSIGRSLSLSSTLQALELSGAGINHQQTPHQSSANPTSIISNHIINQVINRVSFGRPWGSALEALLGHFVGTLWAPKTSETRTNWKPVSAGNGKRFLLREPAKSIFS